MRKKNLLLATGVCLATLTLTVSTAFADPVNPSGPRELAGVGAETTQGVLNALSNIIKVDGTNKTIASYDNAPPGMITTKGTPGPTNPCTITRPNQGGAGTDALVKSLEANGGAGDGCVQFARVVTNDSQTTKRAGKNLTYIPFAVDVLTYAVRSDSSIPRNLSIAELTAIYRCDPSLTVSPSNPNGIQPLLGVFGAGNRTFFLSKLGITDSATLAGSPGFECLKDKDANGQPLLANDGTLLTNANQIVTYSAGPWLAQVNKVVPDKHGKSLLGSVNGISPAILNNASVMARDVYNVVPTGQIGTGTTINKVFVGPNSEVCKPANAATIQRNGFNLNPNCGSTAIQTP
jgi:hypothetical protein